MIPARRFSALLCIAAYATAWTALSSPLTAENQTAKGTWVEAIRAAFELNRQGKYAEAEAIMSAALEATEQFRPSDARLALALNNMGSFCQDLGLYAESEKYYRRALRILDKDPGNDPRLVLATVNNLAVLYADTARYAASVKLQSRYRPVVERLGTDSPRTWTFMTNVAANYFARRQWAEAETAFKEVLAAVQKNGGADDVVAPLLTNLGALHAATKRYSEALDYLERSLAIWRRSFGDDHPETIRPLLTLSTVFAETGQIADAERCIKQALATAVQRLGPEHPITGRVLSNYASVLRRSGRKAEGKELEKQARAIRERTARENPTHHTIDMGELLSIRGRR
jgi:tetratricopeptide (TPR) repeat protein